MGSKPESEQRLGELLQSAGLISPGRYKEVLKQREETGESLAKLLKRNVNIQSVRDLMLYEIKLPFLGKKQGALKELLLETGMVTDEELRATLGGGGADDKALEELLVSEGLVSEEDLARALKEREATGHPLWRTLINLGLVSAKTISDLMKYGSRQEPSAAQDRLVATILLNAGLIDESQLKAAEQEKEQSGERLAAILQRQGAVTPTMVTEALEKHLHIPFVDLSKEKISPKLLSLLPESTVREKKVLPLRRSGKTLVVAMANPFDVALLDQLALVSGREVSPMMAHEADLDRAIAELYGKKSAVTAPKETDSRRVTTVEPTTDDTNVVNLVSSILEGALNARATDIHLEPYKPEMRVRYRIDGMLYDVLTLPAHLEGPVISRVKIMADMDITERRRPQDGHIAVPIGDRAVNMRIATLPVLTGEKMVIRILDERGVLTGLKQLGLEPESLSLLQQLIRKPHGMIQVTGPIGSGKTTTLYSALNEVNVLTRNIVTIEDPVEYQLPGANQMQVNPQIGLSFVDGLRAILRQDADILMIGEIRDPETAKVAAWAALTGQLVLATLHTNDAPSAVTMMSNLQVPRYLLGSALVAVVAQRLVRRLCPHCKVPFSPPAKLLEEFGIADRPVEKLFYPGGCEQCYRTGFSGRTGIFEIFVVSERIRQMIIEGAVDTELKKQAISEGMITLAESGVRKLLDGVTSTDEVFRAVLL